MGDLELHLASGWDLIICRLHIILISIPSPLLLKGHWLSCALI